MGYRPGLVYLRAGIPERGWRHRPHPLAPGWLVHSDGWRGHRDGMDHLRPTLQGRQSGVRAGLAPRHGLQHVEVRPEGPDPSPRRELALSASAAHRGRTRKMEGDFMAGAAWRCGLLPLSHLAWRRADPRRPTAAHSYVALLRGADVLRPQD